MCGIAGYIGSQPPNDGEVAACIAAMRHRGPDGAGVWRHAYASQWHVCLLHTRLSIIDLDVRAGQPMLRARSALTFNGEIYNYLEAREELERAGEVFTTEGDSEVLLAGLARHGLDWLQRLEGMWSFGFYDERTGVLSLSRDRFGEKPLYLWRREHGWYFGSEVKFLAVLAGVRPKPNHNHLLRYLVNGYKALYKVDETFFAGVEEVPRAGVVSIGPERAPRSLRYWAPTLAQEPDMTRVEAVAGVRERLIGSIALRLRADVPLAFCMSGGVDSNSLISVAKRVFGYDVHGFTVMNSDARYEEQDVVRAVVAELGLKHTAMPLSSAGFLQKLRALVAQHDAPVYTLSYYVHWQLMGLLAEHGYKIALSGTAADELFSGYFDHHNAYLAEIAADDEQYAASLANWQRHVKPTVRNPFLQDQDLFRRDPRFRDHIYLDAESFSNHLTRPWREAFEEELYTPALLRNRMLNELFHESVPVILHEDDLNAMAYSIENRSPFLDRSLFEFANRIPTRHLIHAGYAKSVLRDSMRGIVPDVVLDNHRKVGFNAPIEDLLQLSAPECRAEILADSPIFELVDRKAIEQLLQSRSLPNSRSKFLFNFLNAKLFLEVNGQ